MPQRGAERVIEELRRAVDGQPAHRLYAILDGARDRRIFDMLWYRPDVEQRCLYRGELSADLATAAPYLVHLDPDGTFLRWLIETGWGDSWGIFVVAASAIDELRRHFRKFLMVHTEAGQPLYFRFYDPRVLRVYLPTCTPDELRTVFGPVARYSLETEDGQGVANFICSSGSLVVSSRSLLVTAAT
jgi:hypothetical protein